MQYFINANFASEFAGALFRMPFSSVHYSFLVFKMALHIFIIAFLKFYSRFG